MNAPALWSMLHVNSWNEFLWVCTGFMGQMLFTMRFLVQWISSERANRSVIPVAYWYFSVLGGLVLLSYAIWRRDPVQGETGLDLLDKTGRRVAMILSRKDRPDLPLIAGQGADDAVPEAMELLAVLEPQLGARLRGLVRMGERRWDVVLDRDQRILLPEHDPLAALNQLMAMDQRERLLARDILTVDLRLAARPTIRLTPRALAQLRGEQGLVTVENEL